MKKEISEWAQEKHDLHEIQKLTGNLNQLAQLALEKAIRIGELLSRCKKRFSENGSNLVTWEQWMEVHLPFSPRHGQRYMKIYRCRTDGIVGPKLEAQWKQILDGRPQSARAKRAAQRKAQRELAEETEHGITDAASIRRVNRIWDLVTKGESQKAKEQIARVMVSFLLNAYKVDLSDLPDLRISF
jgi:hypothetical protein